ncbi:flagellar biosynthetic protein FliO [Variovorax sp. PBL-E5]|uniref:flagellar biosynthetic protein FliO n=1 Tax=Variovorax sp. PBL-E5 TaxID=434014 RepID=UPI001316347E|nr:flagellar biosynthetic protein FliO [Variovorax sp. PBL-E5]VTU33396.1 Flagellar protein FliO [Variovorax sp. PBL-E5]
MIPARHRPQAPRALAWIAALAALPAQAALPTVHTPVAEAAPAVGASGMLQAGFGMLVVIGLIFACAWLARRFGLQRFGGGQLVKVLSSSMVGQRERVVVVEVGATWLVLGVTASQINTLHTLPAQALPNAPAAGDAPARTPIDLFAQKLRESLGVKQRPAA